MSTPELTGQPIKTIDICEDLDGAAATFVEICKQHPKASSIVEYCRNAGFGAELLHLLGSSITPLAIRCQTAFQTSITLQLEDPTSTLVQDVKNVFAHSQKSVSYLEIFQQFPSEAFKALHAYSATGNLHERSLLEILEIREGHETHSHAIGANIHKAILHQLREFLRENSIESEILKEAGHSSPDGIQLKQDYPRDEIDALLAQLKGQLPYKLDIYYLHNNSSELAGHHHAVVNGLCFR